MSSQREFPVAPSPYKPVRVLGAVGAGCLTVVGALAVIPGIPGWIPAGVGVVGLGLTAAVTYLTEGKTTPYADVAAKVNPEAPGELIAGPAARQAVGVAPGYVVEVHSPTNPPERAARPGEPLPGANWQNPTPDGPLLPDPGRYDERH